MLLNEKINTSVNNEIDIDLKERERESGRN